MSFTLRQKSPFTSKNQTADALLFVGGFVGQNLLRKRKHAAGSLATANRAQDGDSREQTALGNREPRGSLGGHRLARVMYFADDKKEVVSRAGIGILGKASWRDGAARFESEDVEAGKRGRADEVRSGEQERVIEVFEAQESLRSALGNDMQKDLLVGKWMRVETGTFRRPWRGWPR